jgi:hypothetical protein
MASLSCRCGRERPCGTFRLRRRRGPSDASRPCGCSGRCHLAARPVDLITMTTAPNQDDAQSNARIRELLQNRTVKGVDPLSLTTAQALSHERMSKRHIPCVSQQLCARPLTSRFDQGKLSQGHSEPHTGHTVRIGGDPSQHSSYLLLPQSRPSSASVPPTSLQCDKQNRT